MKRKFKMGDQVRLRRPGRGLFDKWLGRITSTPFMYVKTPGKRAVRTCSVQWRNNKGHWGHPSYNAACSLKLVKAAKSAKWFAGKKAFQPARFVVRY